MSYGAATSPANGLAIDDQYIYWTHEDTIYRAEKNGGQVAEPWVEGLHSPGPLAIDGNYIYWGERGKLGRSKLFGEFEFDPEFITGVNPRAIAVSRAPLNSISPADLEFEGPVGTQTPTQTATVTNTGNAPLTVEETELLDEEGEVGTEDFAIPAGGDHCSGSTVPPEGTCTVAVRFIPRAIGEREAFLSVFSDAGGGQIPLFGTATAAPTTTSLAGSAQPSGYGRPVTFTATIAGPPGLEAPTGSVDFKDGGIEIGNGTLEAVDGHAQATFSTSNLSIGAHTISAIYGGGGDLAGSTSDVLHQTVTPAPGNVFIADGAQEAVTVVAPGGGEQSTVGSRLQSPLGVALDDGGDVYIAAEFGGVTKVPADAGPQTTVGSGLNEPAGVVVEADGDVLIADSADDRVVEVPVDGGAQVTIAEDLKEPSGVAVDAHGDVFITDTGNGRVVELPAGGGARRTVAVDLDRPLGVAVDARGENLYVAESGADQVLVIPLRGGVPSLVGNGLERPTGVALDAYGNVYIADFDNERVVEVPADGGAQTTVGSGLTEPFGVAAYAPRPTFVNASPPRTTTTTAAYRYTYTAATPEGEPQATFSVADGALPPGLTLSADGVLSGTPTTAGTYTFTPQTENAATGTLGPRTSITVTDPTVPPPPTRTDTPGGGASQPQGPPAPAVATITARGATVDPDGTVRLPMSCPASASRPCAGRLALHSARPVAPGAVRASRRPAKQRGTRVELATGPFSLAPGQAGDVRLRLARQARPLFSKLARLRARVRMTPTSGPPPPVRRIVLRASRAPAASLAGRSRIHIGPTGKAKLTIVCHAARGKRCHGRLTLADRRDHKLARRRFTVPGGKRATVGLHLGAAARRLAVGGPIPAEATLTSTIPVGLPSARHRHIFLIGPTR